ncbi:hypothetical protein SUDANB95_02101 [Actinosynnema sp. ALI-1.44]
MEYVRVEPTRTGDYVDPTAYLARLPAECPDKPPK